MLGENIQKQRARLKMTQKELAEAVGVSPSAIGMYEQGRREPDAACLTAMAAALSVTPDALLSNEPRELCDLIDRLARSGDVMFHGQPLTGEDIEAVVNAMKIGAQVALSRK